MVLILNGMLMSRIANAAGKEDNTVLLGCLATAALVFGLLPLISQACAREASWKQNLLIFVKTAIPGAYLVEQGLRMVISQLRVIPSEAEMARRATMPDEYYIITAATCMLAMLFVCLQWVATSSRSCSSEQVKSEHSPVIFQYNSNQLKPTQLNNTSHGLHT